jgi:excisionase family DNA binding protein
MLQNTPDLLTKAELADYLQVSVKTLERWEKDGLLHPIRLSRSVRYRRDDVEALIARQASA